MKKYIPTREELETSAAWNLNVDEGHLGGYCPASDEPAPCGTPIPHGDPASWTPGLWNWMVEDLGIRSFLDVGCGEGHAASYVRGLGCDVLGVDGSEKARRDSRISDRHVVHDFTVAPFIPERSFDVVWSCEFVEHVEEQYVENFLRTFESAGRYLFMTYAGPNQAGWHHVNLQEMEYWVEKVERHGLRYRRWLTRKARKRAGTGHFRERGLVFARR